MRLAGDPWLDGVPPHIPFDGDLRDKFPTVCLLPGDPARVNLAAEVLTDFALVGERREYRLGWGVHCGTPIAVCSTGIGGPSTEIAVVELARLGVTTVLRVGGMGALDPTISPGTICSATRARLDGGAARLYAGAAARTGGVDADPVIQDVVHAVAQDRAIGVRPIRVASADSYYLGQGRTLPGYESVATDRLAELHTWGIDGVDMETETVLTVGKALGLRAGALLIAHGNRATDEWLEDYEPAQRAMLDIAVHAAHRLAHLDSGS